MLNIIGMPMKYGCYVLGADLAYDFMYESLDKIFDNKNMFKINNLVNEESSNDKIKYIYSVMELSKRLYNKVYESHKSNNFPMVIGGDHSTAIGSISADLDYYKGDISVIWIDAHADIHNDETTPSGNIHGMPLSVCIGRCSDKFNIGEYKLDPKNIFYIGLRDYEKEEMEYIKKSNITYYKDSDINLNNLESIIKDIISKVKTKYVHISFDFDSLSKSEFNAVNVAVNGTYQKDGGLNLNEAIKCLELLFSNLNVSTLDMVEYNPVLDKDGSCLSKIEVILEKIKKYLG